MAEQASDFEKGKSMIRKAMMMSVYPDKETEYERIHNPIWPELEAVLKSHGVYNYLIFLHQPSLTLFAYVEIENEERWNAIAKTEVCRRWWTNNVSIMPSDPDTSAPVSEELKEVFHID
jgi:L-rhamnose mutarotase